MHHHVTPANSTTTSALSGRGPHDIAGQTTIVERERPLTDLLECWTSACEGHGRVALIGGEAGIGKTAVVRELARQVSGRTLLGACDPPSVSRPFGPLVDIAAQIAGAVAQHLALDARVDTIFAALVADLDAAESPTLIVIDDAQWADAASLDLLCYLGRRIGRLRSMLVVTFREDEVGHGHPLRIVLGDLATCDTVRRIPLKPLSIDAVRVLAAGCGIEAGDLHRRSGGIPFFVIEALAEPGQPVPATIRDAVMARFARFASDERAALESVAVLGAQARSEWVNAMVGGRDGLESSLARGIVRTTGALVEFRHEVVRDTLLSTISGERRRTWHARALAVIAAAPGARHNAPDVLAHHADGADDPVAACEYGVAAACAASRQGAHAQAAEHYARAQRHVSRADSREQAGLLEAHAHERYLIGQLTRATELRSQAAETRHRLADHLHHGDNLRWLSVLGWFGGRAVEARSHARRAIEALEPHGESRELAAAYSNQSWLHACADESKLAMKWGRKAIMLARRLGDVATESEALGTVGAVRERAGDQVGVRDLQRSLALAREAQLDDHVARALTTRSALLVMARDLPRAASALAEGLEFTRAQNLDTWHLCLCGNHAVALLHAGRLAEAAETATQLLACPDLAVVIRIQPLTVIGRVRARQGDPNVWSPLDDALALAEQTGELQQIAPVRIARGEAAWLAGDVDRARREVNAALPFARRACAPWLAGELMFMLALTGERIKPPPWLAPPYASYLRRQFTAAADAWSALGCPFERAWSLAGDDSEAGLRTAFEAPERLGLTAAATRAAERLRRLGARRIPRGRRATTVANTAGLTARELEVLAVIAEGLKNAEIGSRLFISPKTVDHHVSAILRKIDVDDRVAAARWYRLHGEARATK